MSVTSQCEHGGFDAVFSSHAVKSLRWFEMDDLLTVKRIERNFAVKQRRFEASEALEALHWRDIQSHGSIKRACAEARHVHAYSIVAWFMQTASDCDCCLVEDSRLILFGRECIRTYQLHSRRQSVLRFFLKKGDSRERPRLCLTQRVPAEVLQKSVTKILAVLRCSLVCRLSFMLCGVLLMSCTGLALLGSVRFTTFAGCASGPALRLRPPGDDPPPLRVDKISKHIMSLCFDASIV